MRVSIDESYKTNLSAMNYTPNVEGTTEYYSQNGVFIIYRDNIHHFLRQASTEQFKVNNLAKQYFG